MIIKIHTRKMNLKNVDMPLLAKKTEGFSGAQLKALCTEAGMRCLREGKTEITHNFFEQALIQFLNKNHSVKEYIYT
jgi:proteasome regulatory subunit